MKLKGLKLSFTFYGFVDELIKASGVRGLKQLTNCDITYLEKVWFLIVTVITIYGAYYTTTVQLNRFAANPTVRSLDKDYRSWKVMLPAITFCYSNRMNSNAADRYIKGKWNISKDSEEYDYFLGFIHAVHNATIADYEALATYATDERFHYENLLEIIALTTQTFNQKISMSDKELIPEANPVITERGLCYSVNSQISNYLSPKNISADGKLNSPLFCQKNRQCFMQFEISKNEVSIEVHSPFDIPGSASNIINLLKSDTIVASYNMAETEASEGLRDLTFAQRKCIFPNENFLQIPVYSRTLCLAKCRASFAIEMCGCVPIFYPFIEGPKCTPLGFECLSEMKWPLWAENICDCPIPCTEQVFTRNSLKLSKWKGDSKAEFQLISAFRCIVIPPKVKDRRDILFSFEDLLVSFGGTASLFLGLNFWNTLNLIYAFIKIFVIDVCSDIFKFIIYDSRKLNKISV